VRGGRTAVDESGAGKPPGKKAAAAAA
jgi:hypothetical protein